MLLAFALAISVGALPIGPSMPIGSNGPFQSTCYRVQEQLNKGDFKSAQQLIQKLPKYNINLMWDESTVPANRRNELRQSMARSIDLWKEAIPQLKISNSDKPHDIKVTFQSVLPKNEETGGPAGAVFFYSETTNEPRVEAVIALHRTEAKLPVTPIDVQNEISFAIGAFLGLERLPRASVMRRGEEPYGGKQPVTTFNRRTVTANIDVVQQLQKAVNKRQRVTPTRAQLFFEPKEIKPKLAIQGDIVTTSLLVSNFGNSPLQLGIIPDCSCFSLNKMPTIKPGDSATVPIRIDTSETPGENNKILFLYSNDFEKPIQQIPVKFFAEPMFELSTKNGSDVLLASDDNREHELSLSINAKRPFELLNVEAQGVPATIRYEPWQSETPSNNKFLKEGYKIVVALEKEIPPGRPSLTINLHTTDPRFPVIRRSYYVQTGIVALPDRIYLGEIDKQPTSAKLILSRPGRPFKIKSIESDSSFISGTFAPTKQLGEYLITVKFDGKADYGSFNAELTVTTDDHKQPTIKIPVQGVVR